MGKKSELKNHINKLKNKSRKIGRIVLRVIWLTMAIWNGMLFINNAIAFAITKNSVYITSTLECAFFMSVGIIALIEMRHNKNKEESCFENEN